MLRIQLLGTPAVFLDDEPVQVQRKLQRALLYYLACQENPVSRSALMEIFWPEEEDVIDTRRHLREALSKLRLELPDKDYLVTDNETVTLDFNRVRVDVRELRQSTRFVWRQLHMVPLNAPLPSTVASELQDMVNMWHGESFLAGVILPVSHPLDNWLTVITQELDYIRQRALERLGYHVAATGDLETGIFYLHEALKNDELNETLHLQVLTWMQALGEQYYVANYCHYLKKLYLEENNLPLPPGIERLYQKVMETGKTPRRLQSQAWPVIPDLYVPYVGREGLLKTLKLAFQRGGSVVLYGETGAGKTRLVHQLFISLQPEPRLLLAQSRSSERSLPFQPLINMLRNAITPEEWKLLSKAWATPLAWILPELVTQRPDIQLSASQEEDARSIIFEALHQLLKQVTRSQRVLFFLDDAQWSDEATLSAIAYLQNHDFFKSRGLLVLAVSPEENPAELREFLNLTERQTHLEQYHLTELLFEDVYELANYFLGQTPSDRLVERLLNDTGGNPLFVIETLRAMLDRATEPETMPTLDDLPIASSIYSLVRVRLRDLNPEGRTTLETAAVIGHSFAPDILELVLDASPERVAADLDELQSRHLIRPDERADNKGGYVFVHDVFREVLLRELTQARQRLLNLRVAQGLEAQLGYRVEPFSTQLARHYEAAGKLLRACQYWIMAAEHARRLFSPHEALAALHRAEDLARQERSPVSEACILQVYTGLADLAYESGDIEGMLNAYTIMQHFGEQRASRLLLGSAFSGRAQVFSLKSEMAAAEKEIELAIHYLNMAENRHEMMKAYIRRGMIWQVKSRYTEAAEEYTKASELSQGEFDPAVVKTGAFALDRLAILYHITGWPEKAIEVCQRSLRDNRVLGNTAETLATNGILAIGYYLTGEYDQALELCREGLDQAGQYGQSRAVGLLHLAAGRTLMRQGRLDECWKHILASEEYNRRFGSIDQLGDSHSIRGDFYMTTDSLDDAVASFRTSIKNAGLNEYLHMFAQFHLGFCLGQQGDFETGMALVEQVITYAQRNDLGRILLRARLFHAVLLKMQGSHTASREELGWVLEEARQRKMAPTEFLALLRTGELDLQEGQAEAAMEKAEKVRVHCQLIHNRLHELSALRLAFLAGGQLGRETGPYQARIRELLAEIERNSRLEAVRPHFAKLQSYYMAILPPV